jgi:hypothetical protein
MPNQRRKLLHLGYHLKWQSSGLIDEILLLSILRFNTLLHVIHIFIILEIIVLAFRPMHIGQLQFQHATAHNPPLDVTRRLFFVVA